MKMYNETSDGKSYLWIKKDKKPENLGKKGSVNC